MQTNQNPIKDKRGGARTGAGRKKSNNPTVVKRIPVAILPQLNALITQISKPVVISRSDRLPTGTFMPSEVLSKQSIPLGETAVRAGFASPAEPYIGDYLDFNEYLIRHPAATIAVRCGGDSMLDAGLDIDDLLIVDRAIEPRHGHIVMADIGNEFTIKRLYQQNGVVELRSENRNRQNELPNYTFKDGDSLQIVGVVLHVIKKVG